MDQAPGVTTSTFLRPLGRFLVAYGSKGTWSLHEAKVTFCDANGRTTGHDDGVTGVRRGASRDAVGHLRQRRRARRFTNSGRDGRATGVDTWCTFALPLMFSFFISIVFSPSHAPPLLLMSMAGSSPQELRQRVANLTARPKSAAKRLKTHPLSWAEVAPPQANAPLPPPIDPAAGATAPRAKGVRGKCNHEL
jgi:hypothetical protein